MGSVLELDIPLNLAAVASCVIDSHCVCLERLSFSKTRDEKHEGHWEAKMRSNGIIYSYY